MARGAEKIWPDQTLIACGRPTGSSFVRWQLSVKTLFNPDKVGTPLHTCSTEINVKRFDKMLQKIDIFGGLDDLNALPNLLCQLQTSNRCQRRIEKATCMRLKIVGEHPGIHHSRGPLVEIADQT